MYVGKPPNTSPPSMEVCVLVIIRWTVGGPLDTFLSFFELIQAKLT